MLWWASVGLAGPDIASGPLSLEEVLGAVDARVPQLAAAEAKVDESEAKLLAARGAFDPELVGKVGTYWGKDPRDIASASVVVPSVAGPSLEAGWGVGRGMFPTYDGDETASGGEFRVRGIVPLLDGLGLPEARAQLLVARAGTTLAEAERDDKRLQIRRKATETYWKWVANGAKLRIERNLLGQVEQRNAGMVRQVDEGARPRLDLLDNERAVLQRRDTVAQSERDVAVAALSLSLWYRDDGGLPIVPTVDALPEMVATAFALPEPDVDLARASDRPDVRAVEALLDVARTDRARASNALLPDLALVGEATRPLDASEKPELYGGAALKVPTLARKERGKLGLATAVLSGLEAGRRGTLDLARAEIGATRVEIETARQRVAWATQAQERAAEVVTLERRRFEVGGGDLFQLLAREANLASAQKDAVEAALDHELAVAARAAAIGALP